MGIDVLVTYHNTFNVLKGLSIFFVQNFVSTAI